MRTVRYKILLLLIAFPTCVSAQGIVQTAPARTNRVASNAIATISEQKSIMHRDGGYIANSSVVDCFAEMSYTYTGGRYVDEPIRFRLRSPVKTQPDQHYPLIIWLHGAKESGNDNTRQLSHIQSTMEFLVGKRMLDFFMLATQCPEDNHSWVQSMSSEGKGDAPMTIVCEILDGLLDVYPIDRNRISIVGVCSGGEGAWYLLQEQPELVASIVVFSAPPPTFAWEKRFSDTSVWAFVNRGDTQISLPQSRQFIKAINDVGGLAYLTERDADTHDTWANAMKKDKIVAWAVSQDRRRFSIPPGIKASPRNTVRYPLLFFVLPAVLSVVFVTVKAVRRYRTSKIRQGVNHYDLHTAQ